LKRLCARCGHSCRRGYRVYAFYDEALKELVKIKRLFTTPKFTGFINVSTKYIKQLVTALAPVINRFINIVIN